MGRRSGSRSRRYGGGNKARRRSRNKFGVGHTQDLESREDQQRNNDHADTAANLSDIDIVALSVDLRVIGPKHGSVDAVSGHDIVAGVIFLHN